MNQIKKQINRLSVFAGIESSKRKQVTEVEDNEETWI
jgi:ribosomal protein L13